MNDSLIWGFSLSASGLPLLRRLLQSGDIDRLASPANGSHWESGELQTLLQANWSVSRAFVAVGACGAITRLIAPQLRDKASDPAVVVLDPSGRFAIPLLGGHEAGGESLAQTLAARCQGEAVITGAAHGEGRVALDSFGQAWGWKRNGGPWNELMKAIARGKHWPANTYRGIPAGKSSRAWPQGKSRPHRSSQLASRQSEVAAGTRPAFGWAWAASATPA